MPIRYPHAGLGMKRGEDELQVGLLISNQNVYDVLGLAVNMAGRLCKIWCASWGQGTELDLALSILRDALRLSDNLVHGSPHISLGILMCRGDYFRERLFRKGKRADADQALLVYQEILTRDPRNSRAKIMLCYIRNYQYDMTGQRWLLDESINILDEVIAECPYPDPMIVDAMNFAALCLKDRAEYDGCIDDLDVLIELLRLGVNTEGFSGDGPALFRLILAEALAIRCDVTAQDEDLSDADSLITAAEELETHARHHVYRDLVKGAVFHMRFKKFKRQEDIVASTEGYRSALLGLDKNSARPQSVKFSTCTKLARVLREAYHHQPTSFILWGAHSVAKCFWADAVVRCQDWQSDHIMAEAHLTLGEIQRSRYERYLIMDLLDDSVSHFRQSVKLTSLQDARFGARAAGLSAILRVRFKADQTSSFLKVAARQEAVYWIGQLLQASRPFKPSEMQKCLMEIGDLLQDLHQGPQTLDLLDRAICHYSCALNIKSLDFTENAGMCVRMAQALTDKGDLTGDFEFYETAQTYLDQVEALATQRNCRTTGDMPLLGRLYEAKYHRNRIINDARLAAETYYKIFHNSKYEAREKITAARRYTILMGRLSLKQDSRSQKALRTLEDFQLTSTKFYDAITYTIDLMLQLISDAADRNQQLSIIRQESGTTLLCIWFCKHLKKSAFEIVQLYERGRSVLWDRLINSRTQIDMLEGKYKELATRYRKLRWLLASFEEPDPRLNSLPQDRYQTAAELEEVIKEIHSKPGFEDFLLLPLFEAEMQSFASQGPIIYLVAGNNDMSGFALIVNLHSVSEVSLPKFTEEQCRRNYAQLQRVFASRNDAPDSMDRLLDEVLMWLWYSAAEPVLQALGLNRTENISSELPRVWWVTSNWASRLPIQAAGDHNLAKEKSMPCTVIDSVVSSYTPTLRALKYSRGRLEQLKQQATISSSLRTALLVAMRETPDRPRLQNAVHEVVLIRALLEPYVQSTLLLNPKVTRKDVIQGLRICTIAHVACHGEADQADPLRSKLLFQDWGPKPLRVGLLMRMELANCQLAYLSACQTAVNQDEALAEEGLHLSGAFQMAGVPNVIATSWNILDKEAVDVAVSFYMNLRNESGGFDTGKSARALHAALRELRNRGSSPYVWGSYVHFGA